MNKFLSKSQYIRALQCHKSLWLYRHRPELLTPPDTAQQWIFDTGREVGLLARGLFPGGNMIEFEGGSFSDKKRITAELMQGGGETIYEATLAYDDLLVMVDILQKGPDGWEIYEVKSSTGVKDVDIQDLAVQYYVLQGNRVPISKASVVHINREYIRRGYLELDELFQIVDVTEAVQANQDSVGEELGKMCSMLEGEEPQIDVGPHCTDPYSCDFSRHCWAHIPEGAMSEMSEPYDLRMAGFEGDDPLDRLFYPLYFLDFETVRFAVPQFQETRPYQQVPVQFSLYSLESEASEPSHADFPAQAGTDPRPELVRNLLRAIPENACVLAHDMGLGQSILRDLAEQFPEYADELAKIHDNLKPSCSRSDKRTTAPKS